MQAFRASAAAVHEAHADALDRLALWPHHLRGAPRGSVAAPVGVVRGGQPALRLVSQVGRSSVPATRRENNSRRGQSTATHAARRSERAPCTLIGRGMNKRLQKNVSKGRGVGRSGRWLIVEESEVRGTGRMFTRRSLGARRVGALLITVASTSVTSAARETRRSEMKARGRRLYLSCDV